MSDQTVNENAEQASNDDVSLEKDKESVDTLEEEPANPEDENAADGNNENVGDSNNDTIAEDPNKDTPIEATNENPAAEQSVIEVEQPAIEVEQPAIEVEEPAIEAEEQSNEESESENRDIEITEKQDGTSKDAEGTENVEDSDQQHKTSESEEINTTSTENHLDKESETSTENQTINDPENSDEAMETDDAPSSQTEAMECNDVADNQTEGMECDDVVDKQTESQAENTSTADGENQNESVNEDHSEIAAENRNDDLFDSLIRNQCENNAENAAVNNDDSTCNTSNSKEQADENEVPPVEGVEDIAESDREGIDEALSLLPDADHEISEADKERAILAKEAAENETEIEHNESQENISIENGERDLSITAATLEDQENANERSMSSLLELTENEIKEIETDGANQNECIQCKLTKQCKYALLYKQPNVDEQTSNDKTEVHYLCEQDCVAQFRESNTSYSVVQKKVIITQIIDTEENCIICDEKKNCQYRFKENASDDFYKYLCDDECLNKHIDENIEKFVVKKNRYVIEELAKETEDEHRCFQCTDEKRCKFSFKQDENSFYVCHENCLNLLLKEQPDRFRVKRHLVRVRELPKRSDTDDDTSHKTGGRSLGLSGSKPAAKIVARTEEEAKVASIDREASFVRRCAQCFSEVIPNPRTLQWETMDFCNESCLGQYQTVIGSNCATCHNTVNLASLGKYCVRFGFEVRQFCQSNCLDVYKKGLKVCSHCQIDISKKEGFLAPVAGQFKDFCSQQCMRLYEQICAPKKKSVTRVCAVCNNLKPIKVEVFIDNLTHNFCSNPCFSAFKFVNNIMPDSCTMCKKYFERKSGEAHTIYQDSVAKLFCSKICMNIYIIINRKIAPCQWCKVKKYNFDMIQKYTGANTAVMLCSLNCLTLCEVSMNAISMKRQKCDQCNALTTPQYHLTMSDATIRNFCTYQCVMSFQSQFSRVPLTLAQENTDQSNKPVPAGLPKRIKVQASNLKSTNTTLHNLSASKSTNKNSHSNAKAPKNNLVIANVTSLAPATRNTRRGSGNNQTPIINSVMSTSLQPVVELEPIPKLLLEKTMPTYGGSRANDETAPAVQTKTQIVTVPPLPKTVSNMSTMCKPATDNKEILCRPMQCTIGCQTESYLERKTVIPIPVPIYVPTPMHMYCQPVPIPVVLPLPIPIPVFIPTTRNSANGIMKEIKKIQDKMPADPFEAELLMMAEMVAGDKKKEESDSGTDEENDRDDFQTETINENNAFGDVLQMALKMATEYDDPAVDLESAMTANTITPTSHPGLNPGDDVLQHHHMLLLEQQRQAQLQQTNTRKRGPPARNMRSQSGKRQKRQAQEEVQAVQPEAQREPAEKADANMCLKFTFGVNAWKQWVMTKNADLEKSSIRRKTFKTELLQLTADELNYSLCLFVKEVRKPNGSEYAPDTIYYLVLGIQQYLYENGRIDNIFTDPYYEKFTDCLDDVAKRFSVLYNDSQYIVTRVEEEHLWECKQLGAHSPHVLLSTLMFFNTKHFNLTSVEEHMQLSFSHIMKHWKRNPNQGSKIAGSRNVLLRFYPPQTAMDANTRKKKVYEQQENEENPLRCPVKLYEFYLSKCPESVKTRNDVFYLQPERSCVPDSPVWYSTQALGKEALSKMLHRVKMVKEINIALLTS